MSTPPAFLTARANAVRRRALLVWAAARRTWRLSLQLRIITITLAASGLVVAAFGLIVAERITDQLLNNKVQESTGRVAGGADYATGRITVQQRDDPGLYTQFDSTTSKLASEAGENVIVAIVRDNDELASGSAYPDTAKPFVGRAVSTELRHSVGVDRRLSWQHVTTDLGSGPHTYLAVGVPVPTAWDHVELFYFFPLDSQVMVARQMTTTVAVTGVALVVLLAFIAALVTRLVVRPVRIAARTAQRLSAGLLDQRMEIHGEDDLALLGASFNQMAANLQRQIQRLEEMSRLQRRFTSDVSHELRTPLTTVRMATDLIFSARDDFDPAVARSAELLQLELDRFEDLLTDLLEISRFDAGFAVLDAEPTDLTAIVRRVSDRLTPLADRAGTSFELDLPTGPVVAEVDVRRVERILRNLIGNAVEHGEGRPVRIALAEDDGAVAITVRDHGIGLSVGEDKLVFNRFWRSDPSRARQTGGTGLGLSISLEDAHLHGGWLEAWGGRQHGAQFRLTLPVRAGDRLVSSPLRLRPEDADSIPSTVEVQARSAYVGKVEVEHG